MDDNLIYRGVRTEITRVSPNAVKKRYLVGNVRQKAVQEAHALEFLSTNFGSPSLDGWTYKTTRLLGKVPSGDALLIEYVEGVVLSELPIPLVRQASFHVGVWLGLYQQRVMQAEDRGLPYTDYTVTNMIVDFDAKSFTVFDPGTSWGRSGWIYEDTTRYIISVLWTSIRRRAILFGLVQAFLSGYTSVANNKFRLGAYYRGAVREIAREDRSVRYRYSPVRRLGSRLRALFLSPLYFIYVPFYLQARHLISDWRLPRKVL